MPPATPTRAPRLQRLPLLLVLVSVALAVVGLLTLRGQDQRPVVAAEGGTLVESATGPVERVNPLLARTPAERDLARLVFAGLTRPGPGGEPLPDLAEGWEVSPDARVFLFRLRREVSWQDGAPLRPEDAIFTINLVKSGATADPRLAEVWRDATVSRYDERRIKVELPAPFAPLPAYAGFGLLPEHLLRGVSAQTLADAPFNRAPIGTGPFQVRSLGDGEARLVRYDRYHLGAPYLDGLILRFDGGSESADASLISSGAVPNGRISYLLARQSYAAVMLNNDSPLFASDTVRRALSLAVDRRALVAKTLGGRGAPTDVPFAPNSWASDGQEPPPLDLELARSLLASAGWAAGPDGTLRRANRELRFTLVTADEPAWTALARAMAETWAGIGVRVTVAPASQDVLMKEFLTPRAYEAALIGWDPGPDPDPFSAWHSSQRGQAGGNPANFADQRTDELLEDARVVSDIDERATRYAAFQTRFRELAPSIVLFADVVRYGVRDGLFLSLPGAVPDAASRFTDVRRWHMNTRRGP